MQLNDQYKEEMDKMDDKDLVSVWKRFFSKSKRYKKDSKENLDALEIANYALALHRKNLIKE